MNQPLLWIQEVSLGYSPRLVFLAGCVLLGIGKPAVVFGEKNGNNSKINESNGSQTEPKKKTVSGVYRATPFGLFDKGIDVGYYISPNDLLEVSYQQGEHKIYYIFFKEVKTQLVSAKWKRNFGNSFFVHFGSGQRAYDGRTRISLADGGEDESYRLRASSLVADVAIGNAWHFQNFVIGGEWIGAHFPLMEKGTSTSNTSGKAVDPQDENRWRKDLEKFNNKVSIQLLTLLLGISF